MQNDKIKNMLKDTIVLLIITLFAGFILGFVYNLTKEPIEVQKALKIQRACASVFAIADEFIEIEKIPSSNTLNEIAELNSTTATISTVYSALKDGQELGFVITLIAHEGYSGNITFLMGINKEGTIQGVSMLEIGETPGLGLNAEAIISPQFTGKSESSFTYTKVGSTSDKEIDAITGATVTTEAIVDAVNQGLIFYENDLQ